MSQYQETVAAALTIRAGVSSMRTVSPNLGAVTVGLRGPVRTIQESSESRGVAWAAGSTGYCRVSLSKSSAMRLTRISLAQSFTHCSQAVGSGCSWDVGKNGGGGEDGGEGNEHGGDNGGDITPLHSCISYFSLFPMVRLLRRVVMEVISSTSSQSSTLSSTPWNTCGVGQSNTFGSTLIGSGALQRAWS